MLSWLKTASLLFIVLWVESLLNPVLAGQFSADIPHLFIKETHQLYLLDADLAFNLSPVAKEAMQKGIAMHWTVLIKVQKKGKLWNTTVKEIKQQYRVKNHAILNLYSVDYQNKTEMFSSFNALLSTISKIRQLLLIEKKHIDKSADYLVAIKILFDHEKLPIPLRPLSYFDQQWALSSGWKIGRMK